MALKVLYVVPGIMSQTELGAEELERRKSFLQAHARSSIFHYNCHGLRGAFFGEAGTNCRCLW